MENLRVLAFTSLFPSVARPRHGIFVETRLRHLVHDCGVDARVIAPVPWFPFTSARFGAYAAMAATPAAETRAGKVPVRYPRYAMLPKVGMALQPWAMLRAALPVAREFARDGWRADVIDAHYLYPDGVAAAALAERLGLPFVVTARGSDVNVIAALPGPRRRIMAALERAHAVVAVSTSLRDRLLALGVPSGKVRVLRNGVDTEVFQPRDRLAARRRFELGDAPLALCVGNLLPIKGHDLALEALARLPQWQLVFVGDGPLKAALAERAAALGVQARVRWLPVVPQHDLSELYSAADVLLLTSHQEGWPNVVLESLACGTPVVATDAGAVKEMITRGDVGEVLASRDPARFAAAVLHMAEARASRDRLHAHACQFDWRSISQAQMHLFEQARRGPTGRASAALGQEAVE